MLERGANPNIGLSKPLHVHTDIKILELLIGFGADVNGRDNFGRTPLHCCLSVAAMKLLIANGADPSIKDDDEELPEDDLLNDEEGIRMGELLQK